MKKYFSFSMVALALCVLCFPSVQAQDPVPDPMFSPEVAPAPGAVKTMLTAGAYLNSPQFAQSLMAMPATMAPVANHPCTVDNQTKCHIQVWRDGSSMVPPSTNDYPTLPPETDTTTDPAWTGDSIDYVRIGCVWYRLSGWAYPWPLGTPHYRITEIPCGSRNFKVELRGGLKVSGAPGYSWSNISPEPCGELDFWGNVIWCPPDPFPGPCSPAHDPLCDDCEGGDPDPPGGGELP
jgi:hypothetical protein